ncbi:hypothetical protein [Paraburkholderia tropica]|uniref:hypothetical protein n=1 Tax=Paraburkholderia tropica TaxID=92647 RepID=UPI002ABDD590|nr:hypothetical protein [Paraburkholderia tropica]
MTEQTEQLAKEKRLVVEVDKRLPADLFSHRPLQSLRQIPREFWGAAGRIYLLIPRLMDTSGLRNCGLRQGSSGLFIKPDSVIDFEKVDPYLPFVAKKNIVPRFGDLIPQSSWGSSLANLLTSSSWNKLRQLAFEATGFRCEICGGSEKLECHEDWEYYEPNGTVQFEKGQTAAGVQKLRRLMPLCNDCHETYHLGFANIQGRLQIRLQRISAYNRFNESETKRYYQFVGDRWKRRNEYAWALDLSLVKDADLIVQSAWAADGILLSRKDSCTWILGAPWRFAKDASPRVAISTDVGYYHQE